VLVNPRLARRLGGLAEHLRTHFSVEPVIEVIEGTRIMAERAQRARQDGFDRLAVAGGDGTLGLIMRSIHQHPIPLAILPIGTFNNFAMSLGIGPSLEEACRIAVEGVPHAVDLGRVTSQRPGVPVLPGGGTGSANSFLFKEMVGVGVDATAFSTSVDVAGPVKIPIGVLSVLSATLSFRPHPIRYRLAGDSSLRWHRATQIIIANTPCYAANFPVVPEAVPDDGWLDVLARNWRGRIELIRDMPQLLRGRHGDLEHDKYRRTKSVELRGSQKIILHADGEFFCRLPAVVEVVPKAIEVMVAPAARPPAAR
jgi:diacylglycerol kinase (ATP)